ncbi:MAG TPA: hypothetical protein VHT24_12790 [Pseudacidobacterium sp.]|jgi:hypothetical protein|nr:hypothetical protein [Pseudacidobacterium sp.]
MRSWIIPVPALLLRFVHIARGQQSFPAGPHAFTFIGEWDCKGQFVNGAAHRSHYTGEPVLGGAWLQLSETDIEPVGYLSRYLIRYDPVQKLYINEDINNFGYARYSSSGWQDTKLIFTSTEAHYAQPLPENRFVYTVIGSKSLDISWESRKDKDSDFKTSDILHCSQTTEKAPEVPAPLK